MNNWYQKQKKENRCTKCGKQDERTLSGKILCNSCEGKRKLRERKKFVAHDRISKEDEDILNQNRGKIWYTVYDSKTDDVIALGDYHQCCKSMGIRSSSFYSIVQHTKTGRDKKYTFVVENLATGEYNVYGENNGRKGRKPLWEGEEDTMIALYKERLSDGEIAKRTGLSASCVNRWRKARGLIRNYGCGRPRKEMIR